MRPAFWAPPTVQHGRSRSRQLPVTWTCAREGDRREAAPGGGRECGSIARHVPPTLSACGLAALKQSYATLKASHDSFAVSCSLGPAVLVQRQADMVASGVACALAGLFFMDLFSHDNPSKIRLAAIFSSQKKGYSAIEMSRNQPTN